MKQSVSLTIIAIAATVPAAAQEVANAGSSINTEYHEAFSSITPDGLTMYISSNRPGGFGEADKDVFWGMASYDIYVAHRETISSPWQPAKNLGPMINTPGSEHSPMLSSDGHLLYFVSDRTDLEHFGGEDIYVSYREDVSDDLGWEEPINLGESVNSIWTESCPFYVEREDGDVGLLYFVQASSDDITTLDFKVSELDRDTGAWSHAQTLEISTEAGDGHFDAEHGYIWGFDFEGGHGMSDIWRLDPASGPGANPSGKLVNMGSPINTEYEDTMPSVTADGTRLYLNSDRPGGFGGFDIYEAVLHD